MRYSDIEKCCNSSRPKALSLHVQSCLRDCYRASEVESLLIERLQLWFDFKVAANLTNQRGMQWRIQGRSPGPPAIALFLDENEARRAEKFFLRPAFPLSQGLDDRPPSPSLSEGLDPPLVCRLRTPSCLCGTNPPFLHNRAWQTGILLTTNALAW